LSETTFHLFTYGTLGSRGGAGALLDGCERVGDADVKGILYDTGDYPALLLTEDGQPVEGEIWRCPADRLPALDRYEGVDDGLFRRIGVRTGGVACWVYVAGPKLGSRLTPESRIDDGRWRS
jgi:gamma-glutamylcyclotransferase (GGCT)/AIG2-like uncharacterized protein YtfP